MAGSNHIHHSIDYIEINITDLQISKAFYAEAFGWSFNDYGPTYAGIQKESGEAGGLCVVAEVVPGGPLVILYSKNLEDTLDRVINAGGKIVKLPFKFPGGRRFQFLDPSGNELAVWTEK